MSITATGPGAICLALFLALVVCYVLYWVVRLGVRHAISDQRDVLRPTGPEPMRETAPPPEP